MSMIQTNDQISKLSAIGAGLVAITLLIVLAAFVLGGKHNAEVEKAAQSSASLSAAVAALSTDPGRAAALAQSASASSGAQTIIDQARALEPVSEQIKSRAGTVAALEQSIKALNDGAASASNSSFLSSGAWAQALQPVLTEVNRPEFKAMPGYFILGQDAQAMSNWTARFTQLSAELERFNGIGARDRNMPAADKQVLQAMASASAEALESMRALASLSSVSRQVATATARALPALSAPTAQVSSSPASMLLLASLLPALGALGCLVFVMVLASRSKAAVDAIINNSRQSSKTMQSAARLMDNIHSLVPTGGSVYLDEHLVEPSDSPMFPVATAFNRLLDVAATHRDQLNSLKSSQSAQLADLGREVSRISQALDEVSGLADEVSKQLVQQARTVAGLSGEAKRQASGCAEQAAVAHESSSSLQSAILRLEATRGINQEASKRIKRMGESSQAIDLASSRLQSMHQQVRVVAANIATAAAARGPDGRDFMVLADQVQRLVQAGAEVSQDIGQIIELMQSDASAVTSGMERTTADHVDGGRALEVASRLLLEIDRGLPDLSSEAQGHMEELERHAVALSDAASRLSLVQARISDTEQSLNAVAKAVKDE